MSFPEDGLARSELRGVALTTALMHAENLTSHRRENQDDEARADAAKDDAAPPKVELSRSSLLTIANKAANEFLSSDLSLVEGMSMGGETQYDVTKVGSALKTITGQVLEELSASGHLEPKKAEAFDVDVYTDRGRRAQMEDRHVVIENLNAFLGLEGYPQQAFFGVFDGHGGVEAARFVESQLAVTIGSHPQFQSNPREAITQSFLLTDEAFLRKAAREAYNCGATACTVLIRGNKLFVAWLGDSQVMMCKGGSTVTLMDPHKPNRDDEKKRIEDSGGVVVWYGAWRVNGVLSVARAIGDRKLKQWVIGRPDVAEFDLDGTEEYLVLGCDGLWDVLTPEKVVALIAEWKAQPANVGVKGLAKYLVTQCLEDPSSSDNISIIVVSLPKP